MPTELCRETTRFDRQRTTAPLRKTRWCLTVQNTQTAIRTSIERASRRKRSSQVARNPDFFALSPLSHERRAVAALRPTPAEPLSLASACAALTLVAAIASCLPVRLAARIESGADCGTSERGRRSASRDFECGLKGASGVAGSPGTGHPGAKEPARGRRGASPGASLLPDVPPQPRFHDLRIGAERRTSPPAVQSPRCRSEKPVGRLVAVGHGIWIGEPGSAGRAATLPVRFPGAETSRLQHSLFKHDDLAQTRSFQTRTLCPRATDSDNRENSRGQTPARFRFYLDALTCCLFFISGVR